MASDTSYTLVSKQHQSDSPPVVPGAITDQLVTTVNHTHTPTAIIFDDLASVGKGAEARTGRYNHSPQGHITFELLRAVQRPGGLVRITKMFVTLTGFE